MSEDLQREPEGGTPEMPPTVLVDRRGPVTIITINRPERRNAVDLATAELLEQTVDRFEADPEARVIGAAHAGRQGLVEEVVEACVARMRELGADRLQAWVGPHICGACYEVPQSLQDEVVARERRARSTTAGPSPARPMSAARLPCSPSASAHWPSRCCAIRPRSAAPPISAT